MSISEPRILFDPDRITEPTATRKLKDCGQVDEN